MSKGSLNALVLGASGLVGKYTVELLLQNDHYGKVYAVSRKGIDINHPKLIQIIADFGNIQQHIENLKIDHLFSCLGSTRRKTPDIKDYYQVDYDYPLLVAGLLHKNGCKTICIVSALGANAKSRNFYLKLKGETEREIKKIGFENTHIFQPSLIRGNRKETRPAEKIAAVLFTITDPLLIGKLKKYQSIQGKIIASAMINVALGNNSGTNEYQTDSIKNLA